MINKFVTEYCFTSSNRHFNLLSIVFMTITGSPKNEFNDRDYRKYWITMRDYDELEISAQDYNEIIQALKDRQEAIKAILNEPNEW